MKKVVKLTSLLLVCLLALVSIHVQAANYNPHTITIKSENFGHTFEAYQIFKGDLSDGKLTNVEWGLSIVDSDGLLEELKTLDAYVNCENAQDVARVLQEVNTAQAADEFAEIVNDFLGSNSGAIMGGIPHDDGYYYYSISVSGDGYYLVKDRDNSLSGNDAYTKYILEVVNDVSVEAKADYPTLDKNVVGEGKYNNVAVGENVSFILETSVPAMDGYNKYYFVISDTLSDGFTLNDDIKVVLGENELVRNEDYDVEVVGQTLTITFIDFIQYKEDHVGESIQVTYSAELDEDAICGASGNGNSASLTYSNNPNYTYTGENSPASNEPVGVTPSSQTFTYVNDLVITKVDGNNGNLLSGAKFKITGEALGKVEIREDIYAESEKGNYYLLKDGSYTKSIPTESTASLYASTTIKYELSYETKYVDTRENVEAIGVVDESGTLTFKGLKAGTYSIIEIEAPDGYNKLENPIEVVIDWSAPTSGSDCTWSINGDSSIEGITVKNYSGITLPSTGGMGTVFFYAVGSILVGLTCVLIVKDTKRK